MAFDATIKKEHGTTDVALEVIADMQKTMLVSTELQKMKTQKKGQELAEARNMTTAARASAGDSKVDAEKMKGILAETERHLKQQQQKRHMAILVSIGQGGCTAPLARAALL
ncbi:hypothetical protein ColTof4_14038 [Colletotrichum tofieldiae]|nr:hypothetical protein ColTof3_14673 [Colletotrichum tofieldiae]GKT81615.1 hypothetical protein ColTof4_14038 [Colletotrichum tofieldiae]